MYVRNGVNVELHDFSDYEVLEYACYLIKNDKSKMDYFTDLITPEFNFDFLSGSYDTEYKKFCFESFPDHKKLINFVKTNY